MIKLIAVVIVVPLAATLLYAATKPGTFRVQRSATISAPPEKIFALIRDLRAWGAWSPYEKRDPAAKKTYSGPNAGPGAAYSWDGNRDIGAGRMEIVDETAPTKVTIDLEFTRPFAGRNVVVFSLEPAGEATTVTWAMHGPSPYAAKVVGVFLDMDAMIGKDFEAGLANLKAVAEQ